MHPIGDNGFIARRFTGVCMGVILGEAVGDAGAGPKLPQSELSTCETGLAQPTQPFHTLFCSFWLCDCQVQSAKHAITAVTDCGFAGNVAFPVQLWHLGRLMIVNDAWATFHHIIPTRCSSFFCSSIGL